MFASGSVLAADGLLGNVDSEAEELLSEFAASRYDLPLEFAVVGRRRSISVRKSRAKAIENENMFIEARIKRDKRFSAFSYQRIAEERMIRPSWEQTILVGNERHWRMGSGEKRGSSQHFAKRDNDFQFPKAEDFDWRRPFAELFQSDWSISFDEYVSPYQD